MIGDAAALVARLQAQDAAAFEEAYGRVFDNDVGHFVLAHILALAGVGLRPAPDMSEAERSFKDGRIDLALEISSRARFGAEAVAVTVLDESDHMRGRDHERRDFSGADDQPELGD